MRLHHEIHIAASVERVWQLTVDVESWPDHTPTVTRVERLDAGPLAVGSRARIDQPGQPERVWTVTELEPRRRFAWATPALGTTMTGTHAIEPAPDGVTNALTVTVEGRWAWLVGPLLRWPVGRAIRRENQGFKAAAEAADAPAPSS